MPTPTIPDLLTGDFAIKKVWADILTAAGLNAGVAFSDSIKSTPYTEIEFEDATESDRVFNYTVPGSDPPEIVVYYPVLVGVLTTRICTTRGKNSNQQKLMAGTVRKCAANFSALFNTDVLPWHGINLFKAVGCKSYIDPEDRLDKTELRHKVHFNVRQDAWALVA